MRHDPEGSENGAAWQAGFRCVTTPFLEEDLGRKRESHSTDSLLTLDSVCVLPDWPSGCYRVCTSMDGALL